MPFRRRRPLLRTAVIGGGAYAVGRSAANRSAQQAQPDSGNAEQPPQAPQVPQQAPPPASAAPGDSMLDQLSRLTALHGQGALTDAEFSAAKAKLLTDGNG
jgi:hypothetical protein